MTDTADITSCQVCDSPLAGRTLCQRCGAVVYHLDKTLTWAIGQVASVQEEGEHLDLVVSLSEAEKLEALAGPGCLRRGEGTLEVGAWVELLGRREEVFDQRTGGPRQAPEHRSVMSLEVLAWGEEAQAIMEAELEARGGGPVSEPSVEPAPWPAGIIVHPAEHRTGPPQLRLEVKPAPMNWLPFSLLLPVLFYGFFSWQFWPASRVYISVAAPLLTALGLLCLSLRHRKISVGEGVLTVRYGYLPWPRRRVAALEEILAIYAVGDGEGPGVNVRTHDGLLRRLLPAQPDPVRAVLVAALLERVLGLPPRPKPFNDEVHPSKLPGPLPDLEEALRPALTPGDPAQEQGPLNRMKVARFDRPTPKGAQAIRRGKVLVIVVSDSSVSIRLSYVLVPGLLWLGLNKHMLLLPLALPLNLAAAVAVLLPLYGLLVGAANRTTFMVSPSTLRMTRGPLPWPGSRSFHAADVRGLETDSDMVGRGGSMYHLDAEIRGGRRVRLINGSGSEERVWWLKLALEQELGLGRGR